MCVPVLHRRRTDSSWKDINVRVAEANHHHAVNLSSWWKKAGLTRCLCTRSPPTGISTAVRARRSGWVADGAERTAFERDHEDRGREIIAGI